MGNLFGWMCLGLVFGVGCGGASANEQSLEQQAGLEHDQVDPGQQESAHHEAETTCRADSDCALGIYFNAAAGCCPAIAGASCVPSVMTRSEAKANRIAWLEHCEGVSCPPSASCAMGIWEPVPKCVEGVCVDVGKPEQQ